MTDVKHVGNQRMWEILVPTQWNTGKPIRKKHHQVWDIYVRAICGGLTIIPPIKGQWIDVDNLYTERMIPVRLMADEKQIEAVIDYTLRHYEQIEILYYVISPDVRIKRATPENIAKYLHQPLPGAVTERNHKMAAYLSKYNKQNLEALQKPVEEYKYFLDAEMPGDKFADDTEHESSHCDDPDCPICV